MDASKYIEIFGATVAPQTTATIVKKPDAPLATRSLGNVLAYSVAPWLGLGILGAVSWKRHPLLGFLGGSAVGASIYPMVRGTAKDRLNAGVTFGVEVVAIGGSLAWKRHPALGYIGGLVVGTAGAIAVPGSRGNEVVKKYMKGGR